MKNTILILAFLTFHIYVTGQQKNLISNKEASSCSHVQDSLNNILVSIQIKGTCIDTFPNHIDILTTNLYETAKEYALGNNINIDTLIVKNLNDVNFISFTKNKIPYFFTSPESWTDWMDFKNNTVIYTYNLDEMGDAGNFAAKYDLKRMKNIESNDSNDTVILYLASPGYYVVLTIEEKIFKCAMHPDITSKKEGNCPKCEMELILIENE